MTNLQKATEQGNQAAPNIIDAAKAEEIELDVTLAQEQGNQAAPLIASSFASSESYEAIKQQGNQAMPLIVEALIPPTPTKSPMYLEAAQANSTVGMVSTLETAPDLEYSTDGITWQEWEHSTADDTHTFDTITLTAVGDRVYFRGNNPNGLSNDWSEGIVSSFVLTGQIKAGGNVMSLLDCSMELTEVPDYGLCSLFLGLNSTSLPLLSVPDMSTITSIGKNGCTDMYYKCTYLTSAADMPLLTTFGDGSCSRMYNLCTFDMSDDGETLNFAFPTPPVTAGETTYETAYDIAVWMGNENGFNNENSKNEQTI